MMKLISQKSVLDTIDADELMKEAGEAHLLTTSIKTSADNSMLQANLAAIKFGSVSTSLTQLVTPGSGGSLDAVYQALNMGDQNIGVLQQKLTRLCNVVVTLEHKMHHLS